MNKLIFLASLVLSFNVSALTIMEINTEFLWDHKAPHDGRLIKESKVPTQAKYEAELDYYKSLIQKHNADVVGLIEIEGCHIAKDLATKLNANWNVACKKGRDTFTGQDVALITKFKVLRKTIDNHKNSFALIKSGDKKGKRVRPSKALSVVLSNGRDSYLVTVAHLISKRGNNDLKRLAQAEAIKKTHLKLRERYKTKNQIILGDFNDLPESPVLSELTSAGVALVDTMACTYVYKGKCNLIDYILVSNNIAGGSLFAVKVSHKFSDHSVLVYKK